MTELAMSGVLEFYLICYNNNFCVEYQINTISHFCKDPFKIIIIDSNCGGFPTNSKEKEELCKKYGVEYIKMPVSLDGKGLNPSNILGRKLNWTYYNIILSRNPTYFAFLDQDFFMIKDFSIIGYLDKWGMWGDIMEMSGKESGSFHKSNIKDGPWVLHPWLSFYKLDFIRNYKMDWMPVQNYFDTGGANWTNFISKANLNKADYWFRDNIIMYYPFAQQSNVGPSPYEKHYCDFLGDKFYGQIQINNGFMHFLNSSILTNPLHPKTAICRGMLDGILLANGFHFTSAHGYEVFDSPANNLCTISVSDN